MPPVYTVSAIGLSFRSRVHRPEPEGRPDGTDVGSLELLLARGNGPRFAVRSLDARAGVVGFCGHGPLPGLDLFVLLNGGVEPGLPGHLGQAVQGGRVGDLTNPIGEGLTPEFEQTG